MVGYYLETVRKALKTHSKRNWLRPEKEAYLNRRGENDQRYNEEDRIEERTASSTTKERKTELLTLLATLESEIAKLAQSEAEHAESIAGFMERSTHEATRREKNPELLRLSLAGLEASVKHFEASHPQLVANSNYIGTVLANMGI